MIHGIRKAFTVILGIVMGTTVSQPFTMMVSDGRNQFWFANTQRAKIAGICFLLWALVTIVFGNLSRLMNDTCGLVVGIVSILVYVLYCLAGELNNHYILVSISFFRAAIRLVVYFSEKRERAEDAFSGGFVIAGLYVLFFSHWVCFGIRFLTVF